MTLQLSEIECVVFDLSSRMDFVPLHQVVTLDDDLIGTRAADLQVKTLSPRKAKNEGHMAEVLTDSLFNCILAVRFRRRGEGKEAGACPIMERLLEGQGLKSLARLI